MFKNLCPEALGVSGRQSELIELTLTYGFRGLDLDMLDFAKRVQHRGADHARRYIDSAKIEIGSWELPVRIAADEASFKKDLEQLGKVAEAAASIGALRCQQTISPVGADLPYHENFELHRTRYTAVADVLARHNVALGLAFLAPEYHRAGSGHAFIFQPDVLLLLVKTINMPNVGIVFDAWQWHVGGGKLEQLKDTPAAKIVSVRVADIAAETDLEKVTEKQRMLPGAAGVIDTVAILTFLSGKGYAGPVTPFPHSSQFQGTTRDSIVKRAGEAIENAFRAAGLSKPVVKAGAPAVEVPTFAAVE